MAMQLPICAVARVGVLLHKLQFCTAFSNAFNHRLFVMYVFNIHSFTIGIDFCDLHRLISLTFRPSVCQLSVVAPSRLLVLRSTAYQMISPPLRPYQPSGAI